MERQGLERNRKRKDTYKKGEAGTDGTEQGRGIGKKREAGKSRKGVTHKKQKGRKCTEGAEMKE